MKHGLNIMLSLMQLDIGGAETHVVELAKELKRKGFNPVITSNGGAYVKELEECGIKHYHVPLQNKNPLNMLRSVRLLKRIITDEKIDIVHSHARIPSFILGKLHKTMKFPFVTTAHWVFTTKYGLKYVTEWGEKVVAVSEDIKTYLMDNYKIPEGDIRVTINGIDTEKFSPDTDTSLVRKELGINNDDTVIVYVSRMDESRSLVAKHLIKIVPEIDKLVKNLKVVVVGGGDDFEKVEALTKKANDIVGRECVCLTGARTDINKLVALSDLFVGVSRAALEAMAAEKPTIVAGNEGYIGLFDENKLGVGIDTNFCCRGCAESTPELLLSDIKKFFAMNDEQKRELADYGRELIKREYSVSRMADDSIKVYEWALAKQKEILISGYYGFRNSGDDALLSAIIDDLKRYKESPNIVVLSANPKETVRQYHVKAINRLNIINIWRHMGRAEMLISGGGTLIQDATSTQSLIYYITVIKAALKRRIKVMLYSNGIGPLSGKRNKELVKNTLNRVNLITLRDPEAYKTLTDIGVTVPKTVVTADPVFGMEQADSDYGRRLLDRFGIPKNAKKLMGISVRRSRDTGAAFERELARFCDYAAQEYGFFPVFIPMQTNKDEGITDSIRSKLSCESASVDIRLSVYDVMSIVASMDICVGMRLHSLIYAASSCVPIIALSYDPKIRSFMDYAGLDMCIDVKSFTADDAIKMLDNCILDNSNPEKLSKCYERLNELAMENGRLAIDLYEKESV